MEPVVTINLNGNAYQVDQSAHDALKAYLDAAERALASNPDKAEILRDLEQAIADKCSAFLSAHKTVVSADEMKRALDEMGPVEGETHQSESGAAGEQASAQTGGAKKRIYRIRDGAQIAGVCAGMGAYFDLDVNWVRFLFIVAAVLTSGAFILVYVAMMFLIPSAHTSEEWAAAHGVPFNAQEVIDQAKRQYAEFTENGGAPWGPRTWRRQQRRAWKRQVKDRARAFAYGWTGPVPSPPTGPISYTGSILGGLLAIIFTFVRVILAIVFFAVLISLVTTGSVGYYHLPANVEMWQAIVVVILIYAMISIPLRAMRWASWGMMGGHPYYRYRGGEGLITLLALAAIGWFAYTNVPEAHAWMDRASIAATHVLEDLRRDFGN